jgi:hypothetical protein
LYQGTTSVVPLPGQNDQGFSPCLHKTLRNLKGKNAQGLNPNFLLRLYGTTEVVP